MQKLLLCSICFVQVFALATFIFNRSAAALTPEKMLEKVHWLGKQASVKIEAGDKLIYIDPYQIAEVTNDADIILITHDHQDHYSVGDIEKVMKAETVFVAPQKLAKQIDVKFKTKAIAVEPGMSTEVDGLPIEVVPAYNIVKTQYHPKEKKFVGYIVTIDGVRIYHAGDTERIPEMKDITCDIVMLPLGQTYTMNSVEEAAEAVLDVQAKIAIPIHFGMYEGTLKDAQKFTELLKGKVQVVIQGKK